jgi:hypothetical protein
MRLREAIGRERGGEETCKLDEVPVSIGNLPFAEFA